jgi:hypothetical protein
MTGWKNKEKIGDTVDIVWLRIYTIANILRSQIETGRGASKVKGDRLGLPQCRSNRPSFFVAPFSAQDLFITWSVYVAPQKE